jgi:hypothetical protein
LASVGCWLLYCSPVGMLRCSGVVDATANYKRLPTESNRPTSHSPPQATAKLKAAEGAGSPAEQASLAADAVAQLLRVPQVVPLQQMAGRLVFLQQWEVRARLW